jgi:pimeloyl-ACP methyl ester carboxylesterase
LAAFFASSEASETAGLQYIERLASRARDRDAAVSRSSADAQLVALREWGLYRPTDCYPTLKRINQPALIVHGIRDVVVAPINACILAEHLPNAQLMIYPDSGHGAQYQHTRLFLEHVKLFLHSGISPPSNSSEEQNTGKRTLGGNLSFVDAPT